MLSPCAAQSRRRWAPGEEGKSPAGPAGLGKKGPGSSGGSRGCGILGGVRGAGQGSGQGWGGGDLRFSIPGPSAMIGCGGSPSGARRSSGGAGMRGGGRERAPRPAGEAGHGALPSRPARAKRLQELPKTSAGSGEGEENRGRGAFCPPLQGLPLLQPPAGLSPRLRCVSSAENCLIRRETIGENQFFA